LEAFRVADVASFSSFVVVARIAAGTLSDETSSASGTGRVANNASHSGVIGEVLVFAFRDAVSILINIIISFAHSTPIVITLETIHKVTFLTQQNSEI
jgi:hypothetical protein